MSYARFSCDDWRSDVYVYEDHYSGWVTHVAANRTVIDRDALPPPVTLPDPRDPSYAAAFQAWVDRYRALSAAVHNAEHVDIDAHCAGQTYIDPSPGTCATRLRGLQDLGYHIPEDVIPTLEAEQADLDQVGTTQ